MKNYTGILSILIGIFAYIYTFSDLAFAIHWIKNIDLTIMIIIEIIGIAIAVFALKEYETKLISYIGILLNIVCMVYSILTYFILG